MPHVPYRPRPAQATPGLPNRTLAPQASTGLTPPDLPTDDLLDLDLPDVPPPRRKSPVPATGQSQPTNKRSNSFLPQYSLANDVSPQQILRQMELS